MYERGTKTVSLTTTLLNCKVEFGISLHSRRLDVAQHGFGAVVVSGKHVPFQLEPQHECC